MSKTNYKVVSLFSGCGGMDLGFKGGFTFLNKLYDKNPFEIVFSNDFEKKACETYNYNFENNTICDDINNIDEKNIPNCDVIIGGFPCQDFSLAGKRKGFNSERGQLYKQMLRIVNFKKPKIFVAENVEGISIDIENSSPLLKIIEEFRNIGYVVDYKLFNTADYEVPQTRKRIIIIGVRNDLGINPKFPTPILTSDKWVTAKEAIDDLWDKLDTDYVKNHTSSDYSKAKFSENGRGQGNRQIEANKPSITIRAEHHGNIEGHYNTMNPSEPYNRNYWRRLSIRECARLQSFPDTFIFPCAASSAYKQIGNAVPPVFGWHIAKAVLDMLEKIDNN